MADTGVGRAAHRVDRITGARSHIVSSVIFRSLGVVVAAALGADAYVHATSSGLYDPAHGGFITEGNLFRAEALVSGLLALVLLLRPSRWAFTAALAVAATALGAVVLYRYVNVGAIGPIPNLYEPTWQVPGKLTSAYAEAIAVMSSAAGVALTRARASGRLP